MAVFYVPKKLRKRKAEVLSQEKVKKIRFTKVSYLDKKGKEVKFKKNRELREVVKYQVRMRRSDGLMGWVTKKSVRLSEPKGYFRKHKKELTLHEVNVKERRSIGQRIRYGKLRDVIVTVIDGKLTIEYRGKIKK